MSKNYNTEPWPPASHDFAVGATAHPDAEPAFLLTWEEYVRARACVNALVGVPTGELEAIAGDDRGRVTGATALHWDAHKLRQQRAELLAALEASYLALLMMPDCMARVQSQGAYCRVRDAIAELRGVSSQEVQEQFEAQAMALRAPRARA